MFFYYFAFDYPLEYMVENSLNYDLINNNFIQFNQNNTIFWEFFTLYYNKKEIYFENIFNTLIIFNNNIPYSYINIFNFNYDLLFFKNKNYLNINLGNNYINYLNILIYFNFFYLLIDFIYYLNTYIISIIISLSNLDINLFNNIINIVEYNINYILWFTNILYDFLNHTTYKITKLYYIYILYITMLNLIIIYIIFKLIKINLYIYIKFKYIIKNINFFIIYLNLMNLILYLNKKNIKLILKLNFKINKYTNIKIIYILLFLKKIKNIYIINLLFLFIKKLKIIIYKIIKFLIYIILSLKIYINNIIYFIINIINNYFFYFIINKNNNYIFIYYKIKNNLYILYRQVKLNPIYKFLNDKKKFQIEQFEIKEKKIFYELINKKKEEILFKYWKYLETFYWNYTYIMFIKFIKILLFIILFIIKFLLFKLFKYILKISIIIKFLHILIYYIINIYLYIIIFIKHFILKKIYHIYLKIKNNMIYYINMFIHYKLFKLITKLFLYEAYYLNTEMLDKFPYYSSKYIKFFFTWFTPIKEKTILLNNFNLIKLFSIIYYIIIYFFSKLLNYLLKIFNKNITLLYYIFVIKIKVIKLIMLNKNNFIICFYLIWIILTIYIIINCINILIIYIKFINIFIFLILIIILKILLNMFLYKHILNFKIKYKISDIFWYIGLYYFFIYDNIILLVKLLLKLIIILIKYILILPLIIYLIIFILYNNPIIYIQFIYLFKLFIIIPLFDIIFFISNIFNHYITLYLTDNTNEILYLVLFDIKTIKEWLESTNDLYLQLSIDFNWWWSLRKIRYNIFNYYTPLTYFWYEQQYAFIEIYDLYKNIIYYLKLYIQLIILYFFWSTLYIISQLSIIYQLLNYLTIDEFIFFFIYITKIIYIVLLKIYIYNIIYIFIPYYIIQPIIYIYLYFFEYYFNIKYLIYNFNIIKEFKILLIYIYLKIYWLILIILNNIKYILLEKIYNITLYILYIIYNLIINIYYYILIYIYIISDIIYNINLSNILEYIYIYSNIDFLFFNNYLKLIIFKDSIFSSFRFPIEYYNKLDGRKYFQKSYLYIKNPNFDSLINIFSFQDSNEQILIRRWKKLNTDSLPEIIISHYEETSPKWYQIINNNKNYSIKYIYFSYKLLKFKKIFILFPYLWSIFWGYYILIYIITCFIIIKLYKLIFNIEYNKNIKYYISNTYAWDILREKIINNNYKLLKKNNNLYNYYYKQIIKNKEDYIINKSIKNNILNKNLIIKEKYKFINIYKNYNILKNNIIKILKYKNINNIYKIKFKWLLILKKKYHKLYNLDNNFTKKITFNFKNLMILKKYNWLYNIIYTEKNIFNLFSTYYYNLNPYIPYIYDNYYEESYIIGLIKFNINENNYKYLDNKIYKIYIFYKWFDRILLNNKGSFNLFHKDPRVPYISKDNLNNKYYLNNSLDYTNQFYTLFILIGIPLIIWSTYLSSILHITNDMDYQFIDTFSMHLTFWLCWFLTQFSWLHQGILKISFSFMADSIYMFTLDTDENLLSHGDTQYHNWFNYDIRTKNIFPLYNYYNTEYYLYHIYVLADNINPIKIILLHIKFNLLNLYDIIYVNCNIYNYYNIELIIYKIIKIIFIIILILYINLYNKIYIFYDLKKISINLFKFTYNFKNYYKLNIKNIFNL